MKRYYALKNKDNNIRLNSSSGGFFQELAKYVVKNGGVVYGAVYDENNNVIHRKIDKLEEIYLLGGSKYTKSNLSKCLDTIKDDIKKNKKILFSGTPCQISMVKKLTKNAENMIYVDVICHGTPQVKYFDEYKKYLEKKFKSKISYMNMRYKTEKEFNKNLHRIHRDSLTIIKPYTFFVKFENKKEYYGNSDYDPYYVLFDLLISKGCFKCPFANLNRVSDITIGDFHEFNTDLNDFNDYNGVSLVIVNNKKGDYYFSRIKDAFDYQTKTKNEIMQPALEHPLKKPNRYEELENDYRRHGFNYVIQKYVKNNKRLQMRKIADKIGLLKVYLIIKKSIKGR